MSKYLIDTHVHTVSSGHAYSVLSDYISVAKKKGIEIISELFTRAISEVDRKEPVLWSEHGDDYDKVKDHLRI